MPVSTAHSPRSSCSANGSETLKYVSNCWWHNDDQRTLTVVPIQFTAEASEVIALDVYQHADGQPITEATVRDRIAEQSAHPAGCRRCNGRCRMAGRARPAQVLWLARQWQRVAANGSVTGRTLQCIAKSRPALSFENGDSVAHTSSR